MLHLVNNLLVGFGVDLLALAAFLAGSSLFLIVILSALVMVENRR